MDKRTEILAALDSIEHLTTPAIEALNVLNDENVDQAKLVRTLQLDPALTTNLLRFANSAFFGFSRSIHSVNEAVVRLGMRAIRRMVYLSMASGVAQRSVAGYELAPQVLWKHLISSAVCTEILAQKTERPPCDTAFTAALLHDIGKLVLGHYLAVDAQPILELAHKEHIPFNQAETMILGIDHAEVGAELLRRWKLPQVIIDAVRWHHDPENVEGDKTTVDAVHISDTICFMAGTGLGIDGLSYTVCHESEKRTGITLRIVEQILCELQDEVAKIDQPI